MQGMAEPLLVLRPLRPAGRGWTSRSVEQNLWIPSLGPPEAPAHPLPSSGSMSEPGSPVTLGEQQLAGICSPHLRPGVRPLCLPPGSTGLCQDRGSQ